MSLFPTTSPAPVPIKCVNYYCSICKPCPFLNHPYDVRIVDLKQLPSRSLEMITHYGVLKGSSNDYATKMQHYNFMFANTTKE